MRMTREQDLVHAQGFLRAELPGLSDRLRLTTTAAATFERLFMAALARSAQDMDACQRMGLARSTPEGRAFLDFIGPRLVTPETTLINPGVVAQALAFMKKGGNVLLIQNHTSGADTVVWDYLVNQRFDGAARDFAYMAGHVVTFFLIPLTVSSGVNRFQIFSTKYKALAEAVGHTMDEMQAQNRRAIHDLVTWTKHGGRLLGLYPEGGRGEAGLLEGDRNTTTVGLAMASSSPAGLMVLPTYVAGCTNILPVVRGPREFEEFLRYVRRGTATITCGDPLRWEELLPSREQIADEQATHDEVDDKHARKRLIHARTMRLIAALAPVGAARGPWQ